MNIVLSGAGQDEAVFHTCFLFSPLLCLTVALPLPCRRLTVASLIPFVISVSLSIRRPPWQSGPRYRAHVRGDDVLNVDTLAVGLDHE